MLERKDRQVGVAMVVNMANNQGSVVVLFPVVLYCVVLCCVVLQEGKSIRMLRANRESVSLCQLC